MPHGVKGLNPMLQMHAYQDSFVATIDNISESFYDPQSECLGLLVLGSRDAARMVLLCARVLVFVDEFSNCRDFSSAINFCRHVSYTLGRRKVLNVGAGLLRAVVHMWASAPHPT